MSPDAAMQLAQQYRYIAGVDEAGRGPLAGPVVTAAVILDPDKPITGLADSKQLSPSRREALAENIKTNALAWAIGRAEVDEIDKLNILQATLLAMRRAVMALEPIPQLALVDGNQMPQLPCTAATIIKGDVHIAEISAASILAKVSRDAEMCQLDSRFPEYGFSRHKGYPTAAHIQALEAYGVTEVHRRSFGPVRRCLLEQDIK